MKGFSSRTVSGMLLGWAITFEGFVALSIANSATIEGFGGIKASTFTLAAAQLIALGVIILATWALYATIPRAERTWVTRALSIFAYLTMALVAFQGLAMVYLAGDMSITDFGGVGKKFIVLAGAQLFLLAALSLRQWRLRDVRPVNWSVDILGSVAAALLMLEGLTAMGVAGNATIQGLGMILERTVYYAGLQLFLLGALIFLMWTMTKDPWLGGKVSRFLTERRGMLIMALLGGLVALEGLVASTVAGTVVIKDIGSTSKIYVVAGCAQLFALGLISPLLWKLRQNELDRSFLAKFVTPTAMAMLAFQGVFAVGLAADTYIGGIGTILESTFRLAGMQLLTLSVLGLLAWLVEDSPLLGAWPKRVVSSVPILVMGIVAMEGLAVTLLATGIRIADFSSVRESYVLLGGVQLVLLSALVLLSWSRSKGISAKLRFTDIAVAVFALLMLPLTLVL